MSRLVLFLAAVLLSGCASVARQPPPVVAEGDVQLSGRLSVTVAGAAGTVVATTVKIGAAVVGTTVDVGAAGVRAVVGSSDD